MKPKIPLCDDLLVAHGKEIEGVLRRAVRAAVLEHKRAGRSIVVAENGRVVEVPPEEIDVDEEPE